MGMNSRGVLTAGRSSITRLNAGVKLLVSLGFTLALLLVKDLPTIAGIFVVQWLALSLAGLKPLRLLGRFWPVLVAALLTGWSSALLLEKTGRLLLDFGPLVLTSGSLELGCALMLRGLALTLAGLFLMSTTDPTDIADFLGQTLRLPPAFVLAALAALRLVGLLLEQWQSLGMARKARGLGGSTSLLRRGKTLFGQVFALLVQAIRFGNRLALTMQARGFSSVRQRTWARQPHYSWADLFFSLTCALLLAGVYLLTWAYGSLTFIWQ